MQFDTKTAAATLLKSGFSSEQAAGILAVLSTTQTMQASAAPGGFQRKLRTPAEIAEDTVSLPQLRSVMAQCRRWGISLKSDETADIVAIDQALAAAKAPVDARVSLKTSMAQIGLIY